MQMPFKDPNRKRMWRLAYRRKSQLATRPEPAGCEVCGDASHREHLDFDHCHRLGLFRGWLCNPCNMALGNAKDDAARLRKLADYIEDFEMLQ
jgi:hypothetical protein